MPRRDQPSIGEAGLPARTRLSVQNRDLMAVSGKALGSRDPDHSGAKNDDPHCGRASFTSQAF
jgi:hypothetical protein